MAELLNMEEAEGSRHGALSYPEPQTTAVGRVLLARSRAIRLD